MSEVKEEDQNREQQQHGFGRNAKKARQYRDRLLVKHILNGDSTCSDVYLTQTASRFVLQEDEEQEEEKAQKYLAMSGLSARERALTLALAELSSAASEETKTGDIDLRVLPGQLIHDWVSFPTCSAENVWKHIRGVGGFDALSELSMLGAQLRSLLRNGASVARIFCWKSDSVVWVPCQAFSRISSACLFCGNETSITDNKPLIQQLSDGECSLRACCSEHLEILATFHSEQCHLHSNKAIQEINHTRTEYLSSNCDNMDPFQEPRDATLSYCQRSACNRHEMVNSTKFLRCSRCKVASYCSKACQIADWPHHKLVCGQLL